MFSKRLAEDRFNVIQAKGAWVVVDQPLDGERILREEPEILFSGSVPLDPHLHTQIRAVGDRFG